MAKSLPEDKIYVDDPILNKKIGELLTGRLKREVRMPLIETVSSTTADVLQQALHFQYTAAKQNLDKANELKVKKGATWTNEDQEMLESFASHVEVVVLAAKELGFTSIE